MSDDLESATEVAAADYEPSVMHCTILYGNKLGGDMLQKSAKEKEVVEWARATIKKMPKAISWARVSFFNPDRLGTGKPVEVYWWFRKRSCWCTPILIDYPTECYVVNIILSLSCNVKRLVQFKKTVQNALAMLELVE